MNGSIIGKHDGIINYTIGQRRGIKIANKEPLYVIKINSENNTIIVGPKDALKINKVILRDLNILGSPAELQNEIKENDSKSFFLEKVDLLELIKKIDDNTRIDNELWQLVSEQGWLGLDVPEEDGGLGFSKVDSSILSEVFGYYMPIVPIFSSGVVFKQLLLHSPSELKIKFFLK